MVIWSNSYIRWKDFSNEEPNYVFKSKFWKINALGKNKNEDFSLRAIWEKKYVQKTFWVKIIKIFDQILILRASLIPSHTQMQISQGMSWILTLLEKRYFTWKSSVVKINLSSPSPTFVVVWCSRFHFDIDNTKHLFPMISHEGSTHGTRN